MSNRTSSIRSEIKKVQRGVVVAWIVNFLILTLTIQAAMIVTLLSSSSGAGAISSFLLLSFVVSAPIAAVLMTVISFFSWKSISSAASKNMVEIESGPLYNIVEEMVISSGQRRLGFPKIYVAEDAMEMNAFALSSPHGSMIVFTKGLIMNLNREELQAVAAHEWGHIVAGDSKAMTKLIAMTSVVGLVSGLFTRFIGGGNNNNKNPLAIIVIILAFIFLLFAPLLSRISQSFMSRKRETHADYLSAKYTRNPTALASALKKISGQGVQQGEFSKASAQLAFFGSEKFRTHPSLETRLENLRRMGADI